MKSEESRGDHKPPGRALGGAPPGLWAPQESTDLPPSPIYSQIFQNPTGSPQKYFSAAASLCSREIPSGDLFRYSAGGGIDHGGLLHQHHCPSDEA